MGNSAIFNRGFNSHVAEMSNRIRELRLERGWSMARLGERAGTDASTINKLEKGKTKLTTEWMERLAKAFGVRSIELIADVPPEPIQVRGRVQAGVWSESPQWDDSDWYPVWVPIPEAWRPFKKFGVEVRGESMNRRYPEGTVLICVSIIDADIEPKAGQRYIIERTEPGGLHEMTVKELRIDRQGRPWLWPDSDDPEHQEPLAANGNDGDTVEIRAIVITSVQPE